jgi:DNA ligase-1
MSSPAKKRKTNNHEGSNKPVRGLDYFFAKQKDAAKAKPVTEPTVATNEELPESSSAKPDALTDEELARKLQEEWDREDRVVGSNGHGESSTVAAEGTQHEYEKAEPPQAEPGEVALLNTKKVLPFFEKANGTLSLQSTAADEDVVTVNIPFDENPLTFEPSKYTPDLQTHWSSDGGRATYALLTRCFVLVNGTTSRIKIVDTLVNMLRTIIESDPDSLLPAV